MRKHFEMAIVLESNRLLTSVADPNYNNSGRDLPQRFCQHGNGSGINFCFLRTQFWEILTVFLFNFNEKSYFSCRTCRDNLRWLNPPPPPLGTLIVICAPDARLPVSERLSLTLARSYIMCQSLGERLENRWSTKLVTPFAMLGFS